MSLTNKFVILDAYDLDTGCEDGKELDESGPEELIALSEEQRKLRNCLNMVGNMKELSLVVE